ncbi:hypothetical protein GDO86_002770 [Hymenochirus boettgeri]|uniref:Uncharacterized protein n=1 Tax=Hymenochirus boettgeri TaxID=247094 RepID=A0A8T2K385_9PIPI|nr:hypothetical protein GDO86_002770 [Hymenochirus boettgeri]
MSSNPGLFLLCFLSSGLTIYGVTGQNSTILFVSDTNNIRNCSCSTDIRNCDYSLANLMCNCRTAPFHPRTTYTGRLIVWFSDTSTLGQLLNFTFVRDLKLSSCGPSPLPADYLAIVGLQRLCIYAANLTERRLSIYNNAKSTTEGPSQHPTEVYISYLDTSLFNGQNLKSFSVENVRDISKHFPNLPYPSVISVTDKSYVVTIIY